MQYATTVSFEGSAEKAFDLATAALTSLGFRIMARDTSHLDLSGPGMNSARQSALLGATRIQVTRNANGLSMQAELGGVQRMARFVTLFPVGLSLALCLILTVVFGLVFDHRLWVVPLVVATGAIALLWLVLGPLVARSIHSRTHQALDALLHNMASMGTPA